MRKTKIMVSVLNLNLERIHVASVKQVYEEMPSSVVDACPGSSRNATESKAPCAVILITAVLAA